MFEELKEKIILNFVEQERWRYITDGLKITFLVTILALLIGMLIGMLVAIIRTAHDQIGKEHLSGAGGFALRALNVAARLYLTVIRGTPTLVQLLLLFFVFLVNWESKVSVAVAAFAINSGAYVAEIFRSGIMSIDKGQMEAARSLGLPYWRAMQRVVMPQAIRTMIPSIIN